jgi:hydrogenase-4 component F
MMAVGMLNAALYCLLRVHLISTAALGPGFSSGLLLALGLLSVLVAVPFVLIQWNLKRLLAYSSIEHVGIIAVGLGLGGEAAVFAALLHMTYHTFAKPVMFFSAGTLAQLHGSSDFEQIGPGTLGRAPLASTVLLLGTLCVTGSPPFSLFFSEMMILRAGFAGPHLMATSIFLFALVVLFCGFAYQIGRLVLGAAAPARAAAMEPEVVDWGMGVTLVAAAIAIVSTFYLPAPLIALIRAAAGVVSGGA